MFWANTGRGDEHNYSYSVGSDESCHEKRKLYLLSVWLKRMFRVWQAMKARKDVQKGIEIRAGR
jgi:hypothetical protein